MMWAVLSEVVGHLWPYILAAAIWVAGWFAARRKGVLAERRKADRETVESYEVRNEVENRVASESDARERLRRDWRE